MSDYLWGICPRCRKKISIEQGALVWCPYCGWQEDESEEEEGERR